MDIPQLLMYEEKMVLIKSAELTGNQRYFQYIQAHVNGDITLCWVLGF